MLSFKDYTSVYRKEQAERMTLAKAKAKAEVAENEIRRQAIRDQGFKGFNDFQNNLESIVKNCKNYYTSNLYNEKEYKSPTVIITTEQDGDTYSYNLYITRDTFGNWLSFSAHKNGEITSSHDEILFDTTIGFWLDKFTGFIFTTVFMTDLGRKYNVFKTWDKAHAFLCYVDYLHKQTHS